MCSATLRLMRGSAPWRIALMDHATIWFCLENFSVTTVSRVGVYEVPISEAVIARLFESLEILAFAVRSGSVSDHLLRQDNVVEDVAVVETVDIVLMIYRATNRPNTCGITLLPATKHK